MDRKRNAKVNWVAMIHHLIVPGRKGNVLVNIVNYLSQRTSFVLMKNQADLILVYDTPEGENIKNELSRIGIPREKIMTAANGVDYSSIIRIPDQPRTHDACFVGGLRPSKGVFDLPRIWKIVRNEQLLAKFLIIGGGPAEKALRRDLVKDGLSNNVTMAGPLSGEELYKSMKSCRIFVSPSYEEGWGIAICEAMSCRLPVVAYDLPAYEIFQDAISKVPVGDTEAFGKAALELLTNRRLWDEASRKAVRTAERFDWDRAAEKEWAVLGRLGDRLVTDVKDEMSKGS